MKPSTQAARRLRTKLEALTTSPVHGEANAARHKLAELEARYDFATPEEASTDIFAYFTAPVPSGAARHLFDFAADQYDIADLAKWAIENRCQVRASIRTARDCTGSVYVEAAPGSVKNLRELADTIRAQFRCLWNSLCNSAEVDAGDRRPFMLGLYDGMMQDERQGGECLPARVWKGEKKKAKRKAVSHRPGLATHPYTLALELGRKIRLRATINETEEALQNAIAGQIAAKAA